METIKKESADITSVMLAFAVVAVALGAISADVALAGALQGGGAGGGLPYEGPLGAVWNSIKGVVAPVAVAVGIVGAAFMMVRGGTIGSLATLVGIAIAGGIAMGVDTVFEAFAWDGALL